MPLIARFMGLRVTAKTGVVILSATEEIQMASQFLTRRDFSVRIAQALPMLAVAGTVFASEQPPSLENTTMTAEGTQSVQLKETDAISNNNEAIHMEVIFAAAPKRIYEALMDSKTFDKVMAASAAAKAMGPMTCEISREVGGAFKIYGGHIIGRHIELVPDQRIVQAWRVVDWDAGVYSIAKFDLSAQGAGTKLVFDHTGFPGPQGAHLRDGWRGNYFEPMEKVTA
ncbi:MAG TPA: SRPBCC domain-containing protein [Terriglobales bacterium]|nr:SRPBCC domain-containing protein [Terriglobales bacterium]